MLELGLQVVRVEYLATKCTEVQISHLVLSRIIIWTNIFDTDILNKLTIIQIYIKVLFFFL